MRFSNIVWNLVGLGLPLLMAALAVPKLIILIGAERFGFLALAWGLIGYAGALDLGIGRATTQQVAALRRTAGFQQVSDLVASAVRITLVSGCIGMLVILIATVSGAYRLVHADTVSTTEIAISMVLLALALPMQAISATYRGVNEAHLNFQSISIVRIFLGAANFGGPWLVAVYTKELHWLVSTLVLSRLVALVFYRRFAYTCMSREGLTGQGKYDKNRARALLQFGGWLTISSVVSPFLVQADRFFIGALISASAVTLYVIPYEVTVQTLILVGAVTTVAFPVITNLIHTSHREAVQVFHVWLYRVAGFMFLMMAVLAYVMPNLLRLWIGPSIQDVSVRVGQILCVGVFFNAIGAMHFSFLHAYGKTKITAVLHLLEFPLFAAALYLLTKNYGLIGASTAWVLRMIFDAIALTVMTRIVERNYSPTLSASLPEAAHG
jgi:O-antigen/teichoic acid export membrane protein